MMTLLKFRGLIGATLTVLLFCVAPESYADKLDTLKPDHPRLLASADDFERIAKLVKTDPLAKRWYEELLAEATEMIVDQPTAEYELRDGRRLLYVSREVLHRVETLALLYRIDPKQIYLDRIWDDMQAVAAFDHWNPAHFLDVAEMGFAFALAYDWLYDQWTEAQRKTMRDAMVAHAIKPALKAYDDGVWWTRTAINWNQVCNGSLICVALAVGDHEPQIAEQMLKRCINALPKSMKRYAPDGGYDEGPGYWAFGTIYNVFGIAALETALGNDFGLGDKPGFDQTGNFPIYMTGPTGRTYNFGDGRASTRTSPAMFYLADRFDQPHYTAFAAERTKASAFGLLWYDPTHLRHRFEPMLLEAVFDSADVASMRSDWDDPDAWFVAAKGGWIGYGHSQMDLGSFILESQGVRWLIDLGKDGYNVPGYFKSDPGGRRWDFYRNRAEGHNTLVVGEPLKFGDQDYDAKAPISLGNDGLKIDLSDAYPGSVTRTIQLGNKLTVIDRIKQDKPADVWSFFHTCAAVKIAEDGKSAVLKEDGKQLRATLVSPANAVFKHMQARPLPGCPIVKGQADNEGISKLAIRLKSVTDERVEVVFENVK